MYVLHGENEPRTGYILEVGTIPLKYNLREWKVSFSRKVTCFQKTPWSRYCHKRRNNRVP